MKVYMRNPALQFRGILPALAGKLVVRKNDVSTWSLTVNGNAKQWERFAEGWGVRISEDDFVLSGPATSIEENTAADNRTKTVTISGVSDATVLQDSLIIPNPSNPLAQTNVWTASGKAETVIRKLVNEQIGPSAPADYKIPFLRLEADGLRGKNVSVSERFTNLLDVAQAQAAAGDLLFDIAQDGELAFLKFRTTRDHTKTIRLTRRNGAVKNYELTRSAPTATEVIVGGVGTGATRKLWREPGTVGDWNRRITRFVDKQSTADSNELKQAAQTELEDKAQTSSVTFEATDIPRKRFGKDFHIGDKITVELDGGKVQDVLQVAEVSWDAKARDVKLQVGPVADETKLNKASGELVALVKALRKQIRETQTR